MLVVLPTLGLPDAAAAATTTGCGGRTSQGRSFCSVSCGGETRQQSCGDGQVCECRCGPSRPQCRCRPIGAGALQEGRREGARSAGGSGQQALERKTPPALQAPAGLRMSP
ncbi:hypothetical protein BKE38_19665 [Pseudoroseomonas deserti]|uniref:Uncharacterized protein n=2 Tax=Teichococcus deserti TaxID=1817963 RepID=A0A1V2H0M3_9PROT|nr:hypothetical protein BKE38_19665 [Pseudoroseomonas deserti]